MQPTRAHLEVLEKILRKEEPDEWNLSTRQTMAMAELIGHGVMDATPALLPPYKSYAARGTPVPRRAMGIMALYRLGAASRDEEEKALVLAHLREAKVTLDKFLNFERVEGGYFIYTLSGTVEVVAGRARLAKSGDPFVRRTAGRNETGHKLPAGGSSQHT